MKKFSWVYIISNTNNTTLYTGVTSNLQSRTYQHKHKTNIGFSSKYNLTKLIYYELFEDIRAAIDREKEIKKWKRRWKIELIRRVNPQFIDLADKNGELTTFLEGDSGSHNRPE